jgi:hypothetical protein
MDGVGNPGCDDAEGACYQERSGHEGIKKG